MKTTLKTISKGVLAVMFCSVLGACGGGGSDSSTPTPTPNPNPGGNGSAGGTTPTAMTVSFPDANLKVDELKSISATMQVKDADQDVSVTFDYTGGGSFSHTVEGDVVAVKFDAPDVEREITEQLTVTINDSDDSVSQTFNLSINNASADAVVASVTKLIELNESKAYFDELSAIAETAVKINSFVNPEDRAKDQVAITAIQSVIAKAITETDTIELHPGNLQSYLDQFNAGHSDEFDLVGVLESANGRLTVVGQQVVNTVAKITDTTPNFPDVGEYKFSMDGAKYSGYVGNESTGEWVDGEWVFNDKFTIFQSILLSPCSAL